MIEALSSHLVERFQKVLDDPILEAFSIFDVRKWPADKDVLKDSYIDGIKLLYSLPPPLRKHRIKKLRQAKVPWGSKKPAHG